jgi:hypothetical protein
MSDIVKVSLAIIEFLFSHPGGRISAKPGRSRTAQVNTTFYGGGGISPNHDSMMIQVCAANFAKGVH